MQKIMNEMLEAAAAKPIFAEKGYAFEHRETAQGKVTLNITVINCQTKRNQFTRRWQLNGKPIAAAKLATLEA